MMMPRKEIFSISLCKYIKKSLFCFSVFTLLFGIVLVSKTISMDFTLYSVQRKIASYDHIYLHKNKSEIASQLCFYLWLVEKNRINIKLQSSDFFHNNNKQQCRKNGDKVKV